MLSSVGGASSFLLGASQVSFSGGSGRGVATAMRGRWHGHCSSVGWGVTAVVAVVALVVGMWLLGESCLNST